MSTLHVGNAPCSWGTLEFEGVGGERIGCGQMLDELVETGYTGTELGDWGFMPTEPDRLRAELAKRKLTMLGAFVPVALKYREAHAEGIAESVKIARLLASVTETSGTHHMPFLVLADRNGTEPERVANAGRVTQSMGLSEQEWRTFARGAEDVARAVLEEAGLRTVFHHHCAGYIETPEEIAQLLHRTDPALLGLVFDTGHYAFGAGAEDGDGVLNALARFSERIWYMHFKDFDPAVAKSAREENWDYFTAIAHGVFCELGKGCVDFAKVAAWVRTRPEHRWILVEQDVLPGMGAPKESARRNRDHLRSIGV
ncbi:MAG: TIM barrel protein [Candidatus Hydrogenedentes bacterium]|nr:TIM barrel protein [Candidatus Hydrogenedentota bacterium]